jgi:dTMP kinase
VVRLALTRRLGYPPHTSHIAGEETSTDPWQPLGDDVMALLYAADRLDHYRQDILPRLERGVDVVCDRYRLSSLAYQSLGADLGWVVTLNQRAPQPDLTIFLDVPPEICRDRMAHRQGAVELYEEESKIRRVREHYLQLIPQAQAAGERIVIVDGRGSPDAVAAAVLAACQAALA